MCLIGITLSPFGVYYTCNSQWTLFFRSFKLHVSELNKKAHELFISTLLEDIVPEESYHKVCIMSYDYLEKKNFDQKSNVSYAIVSFIQSHHFASSNSIGIFNSRNMTSIHTLIHGVLDRWLAEPVVIAVA